MRTCFAALIVLVACNGADHPRQPGDGVDGGGGHHVTDAGSDADGGGGDGGLPDAGDAGLSPVLVGLRPTPRGDGADGPTKADEVDAELTTFAAGARAVVLARAWRDLDAAGKSALAAEVAFNHDHGLAVLLDVALVDRAADGRPDAVAALPWDDPATVAAIDATVDELLAGFGADLTLFGFGRDVDVYLAAHPGELDAFKSFATHACTYTRTHPLAKEGLHVGVGFSFEGATTPAASFVGLLGAGDVAMVSYAPGLGGASPAAVSAVAGDLDSLIDHAATKPVALMSVGYPSTASAGSSPENQRLFYETLFGALEARRGSVMLVDILELHDPAPLACAALATAQGEPPSGPFVAYACSMGLHEVGAAAKPAWDEVLEGLAKFAAP